MQLPSMPHQGTAHSHGRLRDHWGRLARVLLVGMLCGGVQIWLLVATGVELAPWFAGLPLQWPWVLVGVLSAGSYLLLALLEGFLAASRMGTIAAGRAAGQAVGGISALTVAIPIVVLVIIMLATPISTAGGVDPHDLRPSLAFVLCMLILLEGLWAWGVSTVGGWIGGVMGQRAATQSIQRNPPGTAARQ